MMSTSQKRKPKKMESESKKVKRRKALLFGFEAPHADQAFSKKDGGCGRSELEESESSQDLVKSSDQVQSMIVQKEVSSMRTRSAVAPSIVHVSRPDEVESARKDLPIIMMEQEIMEAINENSTVIIRGETGCGKTTQVPQFLFEAGFGSSQCCVRNGIIGCTQPRRVAVLATAKRVAYELGLQLGKEVGFQVRYDKRIGTSCSMKFMTDGILLRELQSDFLLKQYSVIILDEVHERSLNTDILIGMLSRVIISRQNLYVEQKKDMLSGKTINPRHQVFPLKLVLMSATMSVGDFDRKLFPDPPPVIEVPTRQFQVTNHFEKRTDEQVHYADQAYKKVLKIHKRLPKGGILVFVTGQREVEYLREKLRRVSRELIKKTSIGSDIAEVSEIGSVEENNIKETGDAFEVRGNSVYHQIDRYSSDDEDQCEIDEDELGGYSYDSEIIGDEDGVLLCQDTQELTDGNVPEVLGEKGRNVSLKVAFGAFNRTTSLHSNSAGKQTISVSLDACTNQSNRSMGKKCSGVEDGSFPGALHVLPLYAMLPAAAQLRVFENVKEGERLVVVATNVAETSLTIPGIKYVVDTGKEKVKNYNYSNGMETYKTQWISKASAEQRSGRAGRTGPGHCYRLYSSAVYHNEFPDFSLAEISSVPLPGVALLIKSKNLTKVSNFPFPTAPNDAAWVEAESCLKTIGASDEKGHLTPLGYAMARFPLSPRHSRMLLTVVKIMSEKRYARANLVLAYAVAAAASLSYSNPFVRKFEDSYTENHDNASNLDDPYDSSNQEKLKKMKIKETVKESRENFSIPSSDALSRAYALQCYELSHSPLEFCKDNSLHPKTMEEISNLRKQLVKLVFNKIGVSASEEEFTWIHGSLEDVERVWRVSNDKYPLLLYEEELLRQAICAGWADRVAKRFRGRVSSSGSSELGNRKVDAVRYQACMVKEPVFLDHRSSIYNAAPEFLVYNELIQRRSGPYMYGVTCIKSEWLVEYGRSLCTSSASVADTKPYYEPLTDQVLRYGIPAFGPYLWVLPQHGLPISIDHFEDRVKAFAYALLEGQVLPCLKLVRQCMAGRPDSVLKPEAAGQPRVGNLLKKLKEKRIDSCAKLREVWQVNSNELKPEIKDWFIKGLYSSKFEALWSLMLSQVVLEPQKRFSKKLLTKRLQVQN